ncbi:MAG: hypothetical protein ACREFN_13365 [Acetobacteraceae bacterium]
MNPDVLHTPIIPADLPEESILAELDTVVKTSHRRRSALGRALHGAGGLFARLLERAVPAQTQRSNPPPEIRFPFF